MKKAAGYTSLEIIPHEQNLPFPTFDSAPSQKEKPVRVQAGFQASGGTFGALEDRTGNNDQVCDLMLHVMLTFQGS